MAVNRFSRVQFNQPLSSYVPQPLDMLQAVGKTMQDNYDRGIDESYKLNDLIHSVPSIYDPNNRLDNTGAKAFIDNKYSTKLDPLVNDFVNTGDKETLRKIRSVQKEFVNDPMVKTLFESRKNYDNYIADRTKKGVKYNQLLDDYIGTNLYSEGKLNPFIFNGLEESLDINKRFKEAMGKFESDVRGWDVESLDFDSGIKIGNKGKQAGVTADRVMNVARNKANEVLWQTDEGRQFVKILQRTNPNLTQDQIINEAVKSMFSTASEQIHNVKETGNSYDVTPIWGKRYEEGKAREELSRSLRTNTIEGYTQDATNADKGLANLTELGLFSNDGNFTFNPEILVKGKTISQPETYKSFDENGQIIEYTRYKDKTVSEKQVQKDFIDQMSKMSKATGLSLNSIYNRNDEGKVTGYDKQAIQKMASEYNNLVKTRVLDIGLNPFISGIESEEATRNWSQLQQYDPANPGNLTVKSNLEAGDEIVAMNRRYDNSGKMYIEGYIQRKDGGQEPVMFRSNNIEKNGIYDALGNIQKANMSYLTSDKAPAGSQKLSNTIETPLGKVNRRLTTNAVGNGLYIESLVDDNNRKNVIYQIVDRRDPNNPKAVNVRSSLGEIKKDLEELWFMNTPEGQTESQYGLSANKLYEINQGK